MSTICTTVCRDTLFVVLQFLNRSKIGPDKYSFPSPAKSKGLLDWISICNRLFCGVVCSLQMEVIRWTLCSWMYGIYYVLIWNSHFLSSFFSLDVYAAFSLVYSLTRILPTLLCSSSGALWNISAAKCTPGNVLKEQCQFEHCKLIRVFCSLGFFCVASPPPPLLLFILNPEVYYKTWGE